MCQTYTISCNEKDCRGTTCNGTGCRVYLNNPDFKSLDECKTTIHKYLTEEEKKTYEKIILLQKYIEESLAIGEKEIDWRRMKEEGQLSSMSEKMFSKELSKLDPSAGEYGKPETHRSDCKCRHHLK